MGSVHQRVGVVGVAVHDGPEVGVFHELDVRHCCRRPNQDVEDCAAVPGCGSEMGRGCYASQRQHARRRTWQKTTLACSSGGTVSYGRFPSQPGPSPSTLDVSGRSA